MVDIIYIGVIMRKVVDLFSIVKSTISAVDNTATPKEEQKKIDIPFEEILRIISSSIVFPKNPVSGELLESFSNEICSRDDSIDDCQKRLDQAIFNQDRSSANLKKIYECWTDILLRYFTAKKQKQPFSIVHISKMVSQHMLIHELLYNEYISYILVHQHLLIDTLRCMLHCTVQHTKYFSIAIQIKQLNKLDPQQQAKAIADLTLWNSHILRTYYAAEEHYILLPYEIRNSFFNKLFQSIRSFTTAWQSHKLHKSITHQIEFQYEMPLTSIRIYLQHYQSPELSDKPLARRSICTQIISILEIYECNFTLCIKAPQPIRDFYGILWMRLSPPTLNKKIISVSQQALKVIKQINTTQDISRDVQIITGIIEALSPKKIVKKAPKKQKNQTTSKQANIIKPPSKPIKTKPIKPIKADKSPLLATTTTIANIPKPPEINIQDYINEIEVALSYFKSLSLSQDKQKELINFTITHSEARKLLGIFLTKEHLNYNAEDTSREKMTQLFTFALLDFFNQFFKSCITFTGTYPAIYEVSFETLNTRCRKLPRQDDMITYLKAELEKAGVHNEKLKKYKAPHIKSKKKSTSTETHITTTYYDLFSHQHCMTHAPKFLATHTALFHLFETLLKANKNIHIFIKGGLASQSLFLLHASKQEHIEKNPCDIDLEVHGASREEFLAIAFKYNLHMYGLGASPFIENLCQIPTFKIPEIEHTFDIDITCRSHKNITFEETLSDFVHNDILCLLSSLPEIKFVYLTQAAQSYYRLTQKTLLPSAPTFTKTFEQDKARILRAMHAITAHDFQLTIDLKDIKVLTHQLFEFQSAHSNDLQLFLRKIKQYTFHNQSSAIQLWHLVREFGFFSKLTGIPEKNIATINPSWYELKVNTYIIQPILEAPRSMTGDALLLACKNIWRTFMEESYNYQKLFYPQQQYYMYPLTQFLNHKHHTVEHN